MKKRYSKGALAPLSIPAHKQQGRGILCPLCNSTTRVERTKPRPEEGIQERTRICDKCKNRVITEEVIKKSL